MKRLRLLAWLVLLQALLFFFFFQFTKHYELVVHINPFANDPFDAVSSFGLQLSVLSALMAIVRLIRPYEAAQQSTREAAVLRLDLVSLAAILVSLGADLVALASRPASWISAPGGRLLLALTAGFGLLTALLAWGCLRFGRSFSLFSNGYAWEGPCWLAWWVQPFWRLTRTVGAAASPERCSRPFWEWRSCSC